MRPRRCLVTGAAACALLVAAACSTPPTRSSVPAPADGTPEAERDPLTEAASPTAPSPAEEEPPAVGGSSSGSGLIAAAGPTGLRFLQQNGDQVAAYGPDLTITQPTWSRDGRRLAATLVDPGSGEARVAIVDVTTWAVESSEARRPYFFYTWSHDGTRLAALGPSSAGGTSVDILDDSGMPTSNTMQGGSIFVAWEPGGRRLLVHAGPHLLLISDPDSPNDYQDLGLVGNDFQAAAWVPGTQDFLYVDSFQQPGGNGSSEAPSDGAGATAGPRLVRRNADSGEVTDLGSIGGFTLIAVHPEGDRVALSRLALQQPESTESAESSEPASLSPTADLTAQAQTPAESISGSVYIVDLATAERLNVLDDAGFWLEWSPDGRHLLIAVAVQQDTGAGSLAWHLWDGQESVELARFTPTLAFVRNYLPFADQYTETPRLWSPDSDAIVFGTSTAGRAATAVARVDGVGGVARFGTAEVSFWSPASASLASTQPG